MLNNFQEEKEIGLVLSCIDYRLFDATLQLLRNDVRVDAFDHTILPGASLGFNQNNHLYWKQTLIDQINIAIKLHNIKKIVVVDHEDCGAYKLAYKNLINYPEYERSYHIQNIKKFISTMIKLYPSMHYSGYLLNLDGSYKTVYQDIF